MITGIPVKWVPFLFLCQQLQLIMHAACFACSLPLWHTPDFMQSQKKKSNRLQSGDKTCHATIRYFFISISLDNLCSSTQWPLCQNVEPLHHTASTYTLLFQEAHPPRKVPANFIKNSHKMWLLNVSKYMIQVGSFPAFNTQCLQKSSEKYFVLLNVQLAASQSENSLCCYYNYMQIKSHLWREYQTGYTAIVATVHQYVHTGGPHSSGMLWTTGW